jgi:hypothetical protein
MTAPSDQPPPPSEPTPPAPPPPAAQDNSLAMLCHLLALAGYVVPLGNILGPLIIWLVKKDESETVDYHGKESLNFQITVTIAAFVAALTICIAIGLVLLPAVGVANLVFIIIASVKANQGERYRYPICIRLIK